MKGAIEDSKCFILRTRNLILPFSEKKRKHRQRIQLMGMEH